MHGEGAEYTKHRLPVELVYYEECQSIKEAFLREKQVQGWSRKKREALINGKFEELEKLSKNKFVESYIKLIDFFWFTIDMSPLKEINGLKS